MSSTETKEKKQPFASKGEKEEKIIIPGIKRKRVRLTIQGTSPLLVHKFSEKSKTEMEEKQLGMAKQKKSVRDPEAEYQASLYRFDSDSKKYGIPASGLKNAAVSACRYVDGISITYAKGAFHVLADEGSLVELKGEPVMDANIVRIGGFGKKVATPRYRARFDKWECTFTIEYNESAISIEQISNLFNVAGFAIGLHEWRPEKNGFMGMFELKN